MMSSDDLVKLLSIQALQVSIVAFVAWVLVRLVAQDRPHFAHALWAIVLLKCVTPPVLPSPTSPFSWWSSGHVVAMNTVEVRERHALENKSPNSGIDPVLIEFREAQESDADALRAPDPAGSVTTGKARTRSSFAVLVASVWVCGAGIALLYTALQIVLFAHRVNRDAVPVDKKLQEQVNSLIVLTGVKRRVRLKIIDSAIGPAVIGLLRPTILLPKMITEKSNTPQLESLIAHELIHIRRGDLWWAWLQAVSLCLWWFYPLVWIVERLMTQEAERSCDEETIASLGCDPATYARSLLNVLELKHELRAAPSLPGVRPVDITSNRMERIMRLGHGCHTRRPWWIVLVLLIGSAIALPGAAWVVAQEEPQPKKQDHVFSVSPGQSAAPTTTVARPANLDDEQRATYQKYKLQSFPVDGLLRKLQEKDSISAALARNRLVALLPRGAEWRDTKPTTPRGVSVKFTIERSDQFHKLGNAEQPLKIIGERLYVFGESKDRERIKKRLEYFREYGIQIPAIDMKVLTVSASLLDQFEIDWRTNMLGTVYSDLGVRGQLFVRSGLPLLLYPLIGASPDAEPRPSVSTAAVNRVLGELWPAAEVLPADYVKVIRLPSKTLMGLISDDQQERLVGKLAEAEASDRTKRLIICPKILANNGQQASVFFGSSVPFNVAEDATGESRIETDQQVFASAQAGLRIDVTASLVGKKERVNASGASNHRERVGIELKLSSTQIDCGVDGQIDATERPVVKSVMTCTAVEFFVDETVAFACIPADKSEMATVILLNCSPVYPPIPEVQITKETKQAYVTVSDQLSDAERTLLEARILELGVKDFRIEDGRMNVRGGDDWRKAVDAFQELRRARP